MKILTLNFLTCARKACKPHAACFPLHPKDVELEIIDTDFNPLLLKNLLPRLEWPALKQMCNELGLPTLKDEPPEGSELFVDGSGAGVEDEEMGAGEGVKVRENAGEEDVQIQQSSQLARDLHRLLMETCIQEGKLVCGNCGHEYAVKEGIANFLLPSHLV